MMTRMPHYNLLYPRHSRHIFSPFCRADVSVRPIPETATGWSLLDYQWRALGRRKLRCAYRIGFAGGDGRLLQQAVGEEERQSKRRRQTYRARVIRRTV